MTVQQKAKKRTHAELVRMGAFCTVGRFPVENLLGLLADVSKDTAVSVEDLAVHEVESVGG